MSNSENPCAEMQLISFDEINTISASELIDFLNALGDPGCVCELCKSKDFLIESTPGDADKPVVIKAPLVQVSTGVMMFFCTYCLQCGNSKLLRSDVIYRTIKARKRLAP